MSEKYVLHLWIELDKFELPESVTVVDVKTLKARVLKKRMEPVFWSPNKPKPEALNPDGFIIVEEEVFK